MTAALGFARALAFLATVALFAAGPPLLWVWIGSQVQGGTTPSATAIVTVISGLAITYMFLAVVVAAVASRSRGAQKRMRYAWNRSMRDERHEVRRGHVMEDIFVAVTIVVGVVIVFWFLFYGSPGVPAGA
jgi:hypothetical protein